MVKPEHGYSRHAVLHAEISSFSLHQLERNNPFPVPTKIIFAFEGIHLNGLNFEFVFNQLEVFIRQVLRGDFYIVQIQGIPVHEENAAD